MTASPWTHSIAGSLPESLLMAANDVIGNDDVKRIWQELSAGLWNELATLDENGLRHVVIELRPRRRTIDWPSLSARECEVLHLVACDWAQKAIAMKLGLSPSCVSDALRTARERLGFGSRGRLVRAYCAAFGGAGAALESPT
jgi:DNA-binding NarL/FixJ family response regulator